ncbi:hypothetical protein PCASD_10863 [Puccinia coronata f. sp. avenae]|uniref:PCI domain-containing protein n=1 Tax=Puccinia coronata f. sp. avenae TaxID=200324 RepID=A0A2N5UUH8_9BASI|nr:hypothetical protein PCASD_20309 [Puccinia coronata f. sp. avenae]PLW41296.1 hypothetical protein PCASD_10863 [Puccinia coronata f. sp. avenae]
MGDVHDLDHIKLDLNEQPCTSQSALPVPAAAHQPSSSSTRSSQTAKINPKLEYYLALIASSKGVALQKLIRDLLASSGIYVFGEILQAKPIQELATHPTDASYYELLEIFAYGTWKDYRERQAHLPELNEQQISKLKLLSIITRASRSRIIPYSELLEELEIDGAQAVEELIIDGIYSGLLGGRLDQKYSRVEVETSVGRDVRFNKQPVVGVVAESPGPADGGARTNDHDPDVAMDANDVPPATTAPPSSSPHNTLLELHAKLAAWRDSTGCVLAQLDEQIERIRHKDQVKLEQQAAQSAAVESLSHAVYSSLLGSSSSSSSSMSAAYKNSSGGSGRKGKDKDVLDPLLSSDHQMDIDELEHFPASSKTRKRTRP